MAELLRLLLPLPVHAMSAELVIGLHPDQPIRTLIATHEPLATHLRMEPGGAVLRLVSAKNSLVYGQRMLKSDYESALAPAHLAHLAHLALLARTADAIVSHRHGKLGLVNGNGFGAVGGRPLSAQKKLRNIQ